MNFKYIFFLCLLAGCGVKGDPIYPQENVLPSYLENYPGTELEDKSTQQSAE